MNEAFGETRTFSASESAKNKMKDLVSKKLFGEQRDVWQLGAALGIVQRKGKEEGNRTTFQNINSLDPDNIFAAIMIALYPNLSPEQRVKKLIDHAEWGIDEIARMEKIGTLEWKNLVPKKIEI